MMHAGLPVSGEWPKYVARFNVLYGFDPMQAHSNSPGDGSCGEP